MGKKNKGNNRPQQQQQPQVQKVLKPAEEITIEEKERLIQEGETQKATLIQEGEEKRASLIQEGEAVKVRAIEEGEKKKKKIIEDAEKEAKKSVDVVQKQYKDEIREEAVAEAEAEKQKIIAEANAIKAENEKKAVEFDKTLDEIRCQAEELSIKMEEFVKDSAELETRKLTYKTEVLAEMNQQIEQFKFVTEKIEQEKEEFARQLRAKERELQHCIEDKEYYEGALAETDARKSKLQELSRQIDALKSANEMLDKNYNECLVEKNRLQAEIVRFGDDPQQLMGDLTRLETENETLKNRLARLPSEEEIERLRRVNDEYSITLTKLQQLQLEKIESDKKLNDLEVYASDLENSKRFIRVLELQRRELQTELDRIQENYNSRQENVFAALSAIDSEPISKDHTNSGRNLKDICDDFRDYLASRDSNPLYYSKESIRTFFAGLASSHILILQGMSGTGKSSLPKAFEEYMFSETHRIEVQSSWKDRNDLLGFYNDFEKRYKETKFLECLYRASRDNNNIHLIMLDEMNLSRIEYYFADFLSVLEEEKEENWKVNLISRDVRGKLPEYIQEDGSLPIRRNTWFVGTANKDDSTFTITDKVYDRAIVLNFDERAEEFSVSRKLSPRGLSYAELSNLLADAVRLSSTVKEKLRKNIAWLDERMRVYFDISFGNRISKQTEMFVPAYIKCGGKMEEAIDIIFASKVLRKLQGMYDESTKNGLNEFYGELIKNDFGNELNVTKNAIKKMIDRM